MQDTYNVVHTVTKEMSKESLLVILILSDFIIEPTKERTYLLYFHSLFLHVKTRLATAYTLHPCSIAQNV
jgi:hypothetical protein